MLRGLTERPEWKFFAVLPRADRGLAAAWWAILLVRGLLPAVFAVAMGGLVAAVQSGARPAVPLALVAAAFLLLQVLAPIHQAVSASLGSRVAAFLYDRLTEACVTPPGMGHLEDPSLASDLTTAREFDRGMTGPPMHINMDFLAAELLQTVTGIACALVLFGFSFWAPLLLAGTWFLTHRLLRESAVWRDRNTPQVREAQRHAEYAYRLAVDPPAAKELRLFGLADWVMERFVKRRTELHELQYRATRLRERPLLLSLLLVATANLLVFGSLAAAALAHRLDLGHVVVFAQVAVGVSSIAFGGLSWVLDGAAAPVVAVHRLEPAMAARGSLQRGAEIVGSTAQVTEFEGLAPQPVSSAPQEGVSRGKTAGEPHTLRTTLDRMPAREVRFRGVGFAYPGSDRRVLDGFDLTVPAGTSLAIVGRNGAGKTTLAKLLCRLYDPTAGAIEVDGADLRDLDLDAWRGRLTAVFQDFVRFERPLRDNVAPRSAPDDVVRAALAEAGAAGLADLDTPLARGYPGGTDLSGGQWQRVALARALCAVRMGAGLVLLDEPTAHLDVRGESEIFERVLRATRRVTTILISHRFSTVRLADRIAVLEEGKVVEQGTHAELMSAGGRYRTMFELQAQRFAADADADEEGTVYERLA
jgi:ABC-type multidrug transport system fused ATPase/permease subunit